MVPSVLDPSSEQPDQAAQDKTEARPLLKTGKLKITLISLHGLIRSRNLEMGRDGYRRAGKIRC